MDFAEELLSGIEAVLHGKGFFVSASLADLHDLTDAKDPDFNDEKCAL